MTDLGVDPRSNVARRSNLPSAVLDALPDATAVLDRSGTIIAVNHVWRMFALDNGGSPETTGVGVNYLDVCTRAASSGCSDARTVLIGLQSVLNGQTVESDFEYPCPSPVSGRWFTSRITPIEPPFGGAVATHANITRRKMSERELAHRATHDPLTGLANRLLFDEACAGALRERPGRARTPDVGLLYIDLDDFKAVNDLYGHDAGDEVLLVATHRLRNAVRPQDTIARLGGDEFAVCAPRLTADALDGLARRITAALAQPFKIHGHPVHVTGSVGTHLVGAGAAVANALRVADQAMYAVKRARRRGPPPR